MDLYNVLEGCKNQDRTAQKKLYDFFAKKLYNTAFRLVKNENDAADILQESFLEAFQGIKSFRSNEAAFEFWLKRIVINKALNILRKKKQLKENFMDPTEEWDYPEPYHFENSQGFFDQDSVPHKLRVIRDCIQELHDGYRLVLTLFFWEGYDHQEISEILNIQESTSRTQLMRGRKKLIELLQKKGITYGT